MRSLKKTSAPGFLRDEKSGAVLNSDVGEYEMIRARRARARAALDVERRLSALEARVAELEEKSR